MKKTFTHSFLSSKFINCNLIEISSNSYCHTTQTDVVKTNHIKKQQTFDIKIAAVQQSPHEQRNDPEWDTAKPYSKIPGPSKLDLIRAFLPGGKYYNVEFRHLSKKMYDEYGVIAKFPGLFGKRDKIFSCDPNSFEKIFRTEGLCPDRKPFEIFKYYRDIVRPELYKNSSAGLANEQGDAWYNIRTKVNPVMLPPKTVKMYIPHIDTVVQDFINYKIRNSLDKNMELPSTFGDDMNKWSLESIGVIALDQRVGALIDDNENNTDAQRLITAIRDFFILIFQIEILPSIWKYYKTEKFNKMIKTFDEIVDVSTAYIDKAIIQIEKRNPKRDIDSDQELSVVEKLLKIDRRIAITMAMDMLLAGVDTTSATAIGCMYNLAINPEKQEKLREEIKEILPDKNEKLTVNSLNNIPYLRACIKETLRMTPILPGIVRGVGKNIVINGYQIPKGQDVTMASYTLQNDSNIFAKADEFIPERWLRNIPHNIECPAAKTVHPFIYLPFSFGARACIGRRFAEMEIEILLIRLLHAFKLEWKYGPMEYTSGLFLLPRSPLKFKLTNIENH